MGERITRKRHTLHYEEREVNKCDLILLKACTGKISHRTTPLA